MINKGHVLDVQSMRIWHLSPIQAIYVRIRGMKLLDVSLEDIDLKDERFRISYHFDLEKLLFSIKKMGLVCPLFIVKRKGPRYVVLSGWKRVLACVELSFTHVPAFLYEEKNDGRAFLLSLYENWAIRNFNILEKAEILRKLQAFIGDEKKIVKQFFPLLGIPATLSYFDLYLKIGGLDSKWKRIIFEKKIPLTSAHILTEFSPEDRERLIPLIEPMGLNKLKQFLEDLFELSKKTGDLPETILSNPKIQSFIRNDKLSSLQKAEKIRALLRTKRYPHLEAWKHTFTTSLKKARLAKYVVFDSPSFFEDGQFDMTFSLKDKEAFQKRLAKLQDLVSDDALFSIFKSYPDE